MCNIMVCWTFDLAIVTLGYIILCGLYLENHVDLILNVESLVGACRCATS